MKRMALYIVSAMLLIGSFVQAQEAFYIYRSDNNFEGFFFDEVIRMEYSKYGLDSTLHDHFVVQDIVLADSIHRIPLELIDSISFVQPEIKFNPSVRFIQRDGYSPYLASIGMDGTVLRFENLPSHLTPEVGNVLLGLPTDSIMEKIYAANDTARNSFSCVVKKVYPSPNESGVLIVEGEPVSDHRQVFEQFITVERIYADKDGNIIERRIAGCTPEGFPRTGTNEETGPYDLLSINGKFSKEWPIDGNESKVDLNVDVTLRVILRASYNISLLSCYIKLTTDFVTVSQASVGVNVNASFERKGRLIYVFPLYFPSVCPIFKFNPIPQFFVRGQGMLRFSITLPKVRLGLGIDYTINPYNILPVMATMHLVEPTEKEKIAAQEDDSPLFSGDYTVEGYLQTGILFNLSAATADWFSKIIESSLGMYLYCGPKVTGHFKVSTALIDDKTPYNVIAEQYASRSWVSLSLEAKAETWLPFKYEPIATTFWDKTWEFLEDTFRLAPLFNPTLVYDGGFCFLVHVRPRPVIPLVENTLRVGVFKSTELAAKPINTYGVWHLTGKKENDIAMNGEYRTQIDYLDYPVGDSIYIAPYYTMDGWGGISFNLATEKDLHLVKCIMRVSRDTIYLPAEGGPQNVQELYITTNCPHNRLSIWKGDLLDSAFIDSVPGNRTRFDVRLYPSRNETFFGKRYSTVGNLNSCDIAAMSELNDPFPFYQGKDLILIQDANDLKNVRVSADAKFYDAEGYSHELRFHQAKVSAVRTDSLNVTIEGTNTSITDDGKVIENQFIVLKLHKTGTNMYGDAYTVTGSLSNETIRETTKVDIKSIGFMNAKNTFGDYVNVSGDPIVSGTHYHLYYDDEGKENPKTVDMVPNSQNSLSITFSFKSPE